MSIPIVKLNKVKRKKHDVYQMEFTVNGKRRREVVGSNKKNAEVIRANIQTQLAMGTYQIPVSSNRKVSLENLIDAYLSNKKNQIKPASYMRYKEYFSGYLTMMKKYFSIPCNDIKLIKKIYIEEIFNKMLEEPVNRRQPWHKTTVNIFRTLLIDLFNFAINNRDLKENPASKTKPFSIPNSNKIKFFSDEELKILWNRMDEFWTNIFKFFLFTGLRKGELINLKWENVSFHKKNTQITITADSDKPSGSGFTPKSGRTSTISISTKANNILLDQKGKHPHYVFPSKKGIAPMRKSDPNEALNRAFKGTDISGNPHMFRHTFATQYLIKGGGTLYKLSKLLTHSDIQTTQIYSHFDKEFMEDIIDKMDDYQ